MKNSKLLRVLCYILIPVLIVILSFSIFYEVAAYRKERQESVYSDKYFESDEFLYEYIFYLSDDAERLIYHHNEFDNVYDGETKICYVPSGRLNREYDSFYRLIMYKNLAITNVDLTEETNTIEEIKSYINNGAEIQTTVIDSNVESNSNMIKNKFIQGYSRFDFIYYKTVEVEEPSAANPAYTGNLDGQPKTEYREFNTNINDFEIYACHNNKVIVNEETIYEQFGLESVKKFEPYMVYAIPISSILLLLMIVYLINSIGHTKGVDGIDLKDFDKIPIEIILVITSGVIFFTAMLFDEAMYYRPLGMILMIKRSVLATAYIVSYLCFLITMITLTKRIKAKTLSKTSWIFKICKFIFGIVRRVLIEVRNTIIRMRKTFRGITEAWPESVTVAIFIILFLVLSTFLVIAFKIFGLVIVVFVLAFYLYNLLENMESYKRIEKHLKDMYEGKKVKPLNEKDFTKEFKDVIEYINNVSKGFENAVEESVKNERLKTELITNVSHDIKTPLTSIINYVDLIKKENIKDKKVNEYIEILDQKSQRLKRLTEDLVEVSKASSGNVKLHCERINLKELIKQSLAEFDDKFNEKNLEVVLKGSDSLMIYADNRYMYRIVENLLSNISKYAQESSRVYIDLDESQTNAIVSIKNISKERLNITSDELMQRFVRGDRSRNTEGSGLGISISKSLTEVQGGKFNLSIDGDLFKVELIFEIDK